MAVDNRVIACTGNIENLGGGLAADVINLDHHAAASQFFDQEETQIGEAAGVTKVVGATAWIVGGELFRRRRETVADVVDLE